MKNISKWLVSIFFSFSCLILFPKSVYMDSMPFSVTPILPANQIDQDKSYFDLKTKPNQEENLQVKVTNNTDESIIIEVQANTATTNDHGVADYGLSTKSKDSSLKTSFSEITHISEKEVSLNGREEKIVNVTVEMPSEKYDGLILGGLQFSEKEDEIDSNQNENQISNRFAYVIGVSLRETDEQVTPRLKCNQVYADQEKYQKAIKVNLQNPESEIIKSLSVEAKVFSKNGKKLLVKEQKENMRMVPNSNFDFAILLNNSDFKAGEYRIELHAVADGTVYDWVKYLNIKPQLANKLNDSHQETVNKNYKTYVAILFVIVFIILLSIIIWKKRYKYKKT